MGEVMLGHLGVESALVHVMFILVAKLLLGSKCVSLSMCMACLLCYERTQRAGAVECSYLVENLGN